jgi:APA family basic amino acid/polyamine antiporter
MTSQIKPKLRLFDGSMAVVSLVIGIGIFRTPAIIAADTGTPGLFFGAWVLGAIISMVGAMIFAEIGSRRPQAGGYYKIVSECYHPAFAFMINYVGLLMTTGAGFAAVALMGAEYIVPLLPFESFQTLSGIKWFAVIMVTGLFLVNYAGVKMGAMVVNILTIIKILTILTFVVLAFWSGDGPAPQTSTTLSAETSIFAALGMGMIAVFYTFGGYQNTMNLGSDVKRPKRNMPWGIVSGMLIVTLLYLSINFGYFRLLGIDGIAKSPLIAADMASIIFGPAGSKVISVVIFISVLGFLNITMMQGARMYHAMAEDKILPPIFSKVNSKTQVQEFTLLFITLLTLSFIILQGTFERILNMVMVNDGIILAITASSVLFLRYGKMANKHFDGFKLPLFPVLPAVYILFLLMISISAFIKDPVSGLVSIALLVAGFPLYLLLRKMVK